jgi:hypothetical protein
MRCTLKLDSDCVFGMVGKLEGKLAFSGGCDFFFWAMFLD